MAEKMTDAEKALEEFNTHEITCNGVTVKACVSFSFQTRTEIRAALKAQENPVEVRLDLINIAFQDVPVGGEADFILKNFPNGIKIIEVK